jgi:putative transcriptional regulator
MPIIVTLDAVLHERQMTITELSDAIGISRPNMSILKTNKGSAIRFSTLYSICKVLNCEPGDILQFVDDGEDISELRKKNRNIQRDLED